jgi:hypothetical protein
MVVKHELTPEAFLSAPRRDAAVPNQDGTLAFFTTSAHEFGAGEDGAGRTTREVVVLSLASGETRVLSGDPDVHDVQWIPGDLGPSGSGGGGPLMWLESTAKGGGDGETRMRVVTPSFSGEEGSSPDPASGYIAGVIPAPVRALKLRALEDGSVACAVVARVAADGGMFNEVTAKKSPSSARIYDGWNVREVGCFSSQTPSLPL